MAGKTNLLQTVFASKKLVSKANTSLAATDNQEIIGSAVQISAQTIFGQDVPNSPSKNLYTVQGPAGKPETVEYVQFDLIPINASVYDANDFDSDASAQISGHHAYAFVMTGSYQTLSNNPNKGKGHFVNGRHLTGTLGDIQIIPPSFSKEAPNPYICTIYSGSRDLQDQIQLTDEIDWYVDYYSGILYVQDYNSSKIPTRAKAFVYVGKMLSASLSSGGGGLGTGVGWIPSNGGISTTGSVFFGTSGASIAGSDIYFSNLGAAIFNQQQNNADFRVASVNKSSALEIDASSNKVLILSGGAGVSSDEAVAPDISFYVSGSVGALGGNSGGSSLFGGDVSVSGSFKVFNGISGSLTKTHEGKSYLVAGSDISIVSSSNGQITISSAGGGGSTVDSDGDTKIQVEESSDEDKIRFDTAGSERMIIDNVGNIGFGLSSPQKQVHVYNSSTSSLRIGAQSTSEQNHSLLEFAEQVNVSGEMNFGFSMGYDGVKNHFVMKNHNDNVAGRDIWTMTRSGAKHFFGVTPSDSEGDEYGKDNYFYVSGALGSRGTADSGTAVFGGDVVVSGSLSINRSESGGFSMVTVTNDGKVGIGTDTPAHKLSVGGNMDVGEYIYHKNDTDTFIQFADDAIGFTAGGEQLLTIAEAGTDMVTVGDGGDVDFRVRTENDDNTLYIEGSTDRIGIGTNSPASIVHITEAAPTLTIQRENNSNTSTIDFVGALGNTANSITHDASTNDLVFKTFNGSGTEEIMRVGDHYGTSKRQIILLSGSGIHAEATQPKEASDISFFVSGSIGSKDTTTRGTSVIGGDLVVSGTIYNASGNPVDGGVNYTGGLGSNNQMITADGSGDIVAEPNISFNGSQLEVTGSILPGADKVYDLGGPNNRFANIYTGDLHLRNERGHWTIVEEAEYLTVVNNLTGKKYKMVLEPLE